MKCNRNNESSVVCVVALTSALPHLQFTQDGEVAAARYDLGESDRLLASTLKNRDHLLTTCSHAVWETRLGTEWFKRERRRVVVGAAVLWGSAISRSRERHTAC